MSGNRVTFTPEPIIYLYSSHRRFNTISSITFGVSTSFSLQSLGEEIIMGIHSLGRDILGIFNASINRGAISSSLKPAMPHPMRVSRNRFRGCCLAYSKNLSIYGFIADRGPCIVGMAYDCPWGPTPCPQTAPNLSCAIRAAAPACRPSRFDPKTNISHRDKFVTKSGVIRLLTLFIARTI